MSNSSTDPATDPTLPQVSYDDEEGYFDIELWRDDRWIRRSFPSYAPPTCLVVKDPKDIPAACSQLHMPIPKDHTGRLYCLMFVATQFGAGTTSFGIYLRSKEEAKCITKKLDEIKAQDKK